MIDQGVFEFEFRLAVLSNNDRIPLDSVVISEVVLVFGEEGRHSGPVGIRVPAAVTIRLVSDLIGGFSQNRLLLVRLNTQSSRELSIRFGHPASNDVPSSLNWSRTFGQTGLKLHDRLYVIALVFPEHPTKCAVFLASQVQRLGSLVYDYVLVLSLGLDEIVVSWRLQVVRVLLHHRRMRRIVVTLTKWRILNVLQGIQVFDVVGN